MALQHSVIVQRFVGALEPRKQIIFWVGPVWIVQKAFKEAVQERPVLNIAGVRWRNWRAARAVQDDVAVDRDDFLFGVQHWRDAVNSAGILNEEQRILDFGKSLPFLLLTGQAVGAKLENQIFLWKVEQAITCKLVVARPVVVDASNGLTDLVCLISAHERAAQYLSPADKAFASAIRVADDAMLSDLTTSAVHAIADPEQWNPLAHLESFQTIRIALQDFFGYNVKRNAVLALNRLASNRLEQRRCHNLWI